MASGTLLISLCTQTAFAQLKEERAHSYGGYDVKNYAMDVLEGSANTILAGTVFAPSGETSIHLMLSDNSTVPGNTFVTTRLDDPGFDERAIDAHFWRGNIDDLIIIASRRDVNGGPMMIEVLRADGIGQVVSGNIIFDKAGENLHPLGTAMEGDQLYICGYTTLSGGPWIPDYRTSKEIFIVQYDLSQERVVKSFRHDYPAVAPGNDYDMATRIKILSNGNIFVTGSCNVDDPSVPLYDSLSKGYYCGTLSLTLDAGLNIIYDKPVSAYLPVVGGGTNIIARGEAGFDITEDPVGNGYFIFSNTFVAEAHTPIPLMQPFHVTFVDNNMDVPAAMQNRYRGPGFDVVWGVNLVPGNIDATTILSGYQNSRPWPNSPFPTLPSNINPFLAELKLEYNGVIDVQALYFSTILSNEGTGDPLLYPNNFTDLGGYFSNLAWGPPNARRDLSYARGIYLSAPIWNPDGFSHLNMKMINAWEDGTVNCPIDKLQAGGDVVNAWQCNGGVQTLDIADNARYYTEQDFSFDPDNIYECYDASGVFRPTGIASRDGIIASVTLSPNPAQDYIVATVEGLTGDAAVSITLTDITGKQLGILYDGKATGLNENRIKLPQLPAGLYLVVIGNKDHSIATKKLEIR